MGAEVDVGYEWEVKVGGTAFGLAKDVRLRGSATSVDVSRKDGNGWKNKKQGLKEWFADIESLFVASNAQVQVLRDAWLNGTPVAMEWLDPTGNGFTGSALVMDIEVGQPLDDGVEFPVSLEGDGALTPVGPAS